MLYIRVSAESGSALPIWVLETGQDGEDDVLIGSRENVFQDICSFHDMTELPPHWHLKLFEQGSTRE